MNGFELTLLAVLLSLVGALLLIDQIGVDVIDAYLRSIQA
jgi:hypothetical protein